MQVVVQEGEFDPTKVVVPIVALNDEDGSVEFLGSGFFVGEESFLVTAHHVIKGKDYIDIVVLPNLDNVYTATLIKEDTEVDLSVLHVEGYRPERRLALYPDNNLLFNQPCVCCEYGTTRSLGNRVEISPAVRMGNITRCFKSLDFYGKAGEMALELSFPALQGASGAPIMTSDNFLVMGIIIANLAYHLLPAQIEETLNQDGEKVEEVRYMLPQAIAVHVKHLRMLLE
jgi:hypothetical protein